MLGATRLARQPSSHSVKLITLMMMVIVGLLTILPVILTRFPPINDYPSHLARAVILHNIADPILDRFYEQGSLLLPNLAMDVVILVLAQFMKAETAAQVFVALCILVPLAGAVLLYRAAHGRLTIWPLLAVVVVHNGILAFGFLNYLFGLGLALMAMATWMTMRRGNARLFVAFLWSVLLMFCHLQAFAVFAIMAASTELYTAFERWQQVRNWRPWLELVYAGTPFFVVLALFFIVSPTADAIAEGSIFGGRWLDKPYALLLSLSVRVLWLDMLTALILLALLVWLFMRGGLTIVKPLLVAAVLLSLTALCMPRGLMGGYYADIRLGPAIVLVALAALSFKSDERGLNRRVVMLAVCTLVLVRVGALSAIWLADEKQLKPVMSAFEKIEPGATLFAVSVERFPNPVVYDEATRAAWHPPMIHVSSYAVLAKPIFMPLLHTNPTQQPLVIEPTYRPLKVLQRDMPFKTYTNAAFLARLEDFKHRLNGTEWPELDAVYLFVVGYSELDESVMPTYVTQVDQGERFALLRFE